MVLSGHIEVTPEGAVRSLVLDQKAMVAPSIASFVEGTIGGWRFEPTLRDGQAVATRAPCAFACAARLRPMAVMKSA